MSQDGFSQIDLTAPGFASSQELFLLNSFDINLLNISTVEKALDPNVQPNEQPMDPNVESNAQQDPSLLNVAGSANVDDKNVKRLSLRRNSGNREHWRKVAGVWVPSEKYREERREARARSRRSQRKYVSVEPATPSKVEMTQSKVVTENESDKSNDSLALMAVSQHCSTVNRKYLKATKASSSSSKASLAPAPVTNSNIPNTEIPSLSPKVQVNVVLRRFDLRRFTITPVGAGVGFPRRFIQEIFTDWYKNYFCPTVLKFCDRNNLPKKSILLLDNALGHQENLETLETELDVKVIYMPSNTISVL
ncbi:uncharacterized protein [Onthophagus taurus]|uniref:uncharacterized protein isoform X1 n=1 Tax=Onthophagus taurus TaxID=166361 RepID=UPI0039BECA0D